MDIFLGKEERELVKALNQALGMRHRTKSYNFKNPEDIIEAVTYITAEFIDFYYYWATLDDIEGKFDESIETYYPAEWQKLHLPETKVKKNLGDAFQKLRKTSDSFWKLMKDAEKQCKSMWTIIFKNAPDEVLNNLFGKVFRPKPEYIEKLLEMEFVNMDLWQYTVEESAATFMSAMVEYYEKNICE
ncbi:MAG: hypothetical protein ACOY46_19660 [Bacillota bacterium]